MISPSDIDNTMLEIDSASQDHLRRLDFRGLPGQYALLPKSNNSVPKLLFGAPKPGDMMRSVSSLARSLGPGRYFFSDTRDPDLGFKSIVGWAHGCYRYDRLQAKQAHPPCLLVGDTAFGRRARAVIKGADTARMLIDEPSNVLGPQQLAEAARKIGDSYGARTTICDAPEELKTKYPLCHAVGRSSPNPPAVVDLRWGQPNHLSITLIGKGVCFDAGGLNLKQTSSMRFMKRDMAGAAIMLGLAQTIMDQNLPIYLRLLIPCVENLLSNDGLRPSDVITDAFGTSIEIANTDAEGRLVLAELLREADAERPDLIIDCGSLTGSPRTVLGPDFAVALSSNISAFDELTALSLQAEDPIWPLPLWAPYRSWLNSSVADIANTTNGLGLAGPIVAGLFLSEFVKNTASWLHLDASGWNTLSRPGRPEGAEATAYYALERFINLIAKRQSLTKES
jgi:leucyl aminopeptidase